MRMGIGLGVGINRSNYAQGIFSAYQSRVVADGGVTEAGACVDAVSGLLQTASLLLIPSGYKGGKAYAEIPTNGNGDLTWTRASTALRTNSSGLLESMGSGVPRLSYMYGSCPALLLEPQRTNLALYSEDFSSGTWTKVAGTVTSNSTSAPDGSTTADTFTSSGTSNTIVVRTTSVTSGSTYSLSFYVKQGTQRFVYIRFTSNSLMNNFVSVVYDLQDGTVGQTQVGSSSGTLVSASVQSAGNGFYRLILVASINQIDGNMGIGFASAKTGNTFSNFGAINSTITSGNDFYLWGAQLELGAYATTIIPTTTASATRIADSFSRNNIYTNGLITSSGGTWFVEFAVNQTNTRDSSQGMFIGDSTNIYTGNQIVLLSGSTGTIQINKVVSGTGTTLYQSSNAQLKFAIKWNGTSADIFANGTKVVSATSFTATNMENLIGQSGTPFFVKNMALFNSPLTDTQCQTLTTL